MNYRKKKDELFSDNFYKVYQSSMKMTKNHPEFDLKIYKEQQNGKNFHLFLTQIELLFLTSSKTLIPQTLKGREFL